MPRDILYLVEQALESQGFESLRTRGFERGESFDCVLTRIPAARMAKFAVEVSKLHPYVLVHVSGAYDEGIEFAIYRIGDIDEKGSPWPLPTPKRGVTPFFGGSLRGKLE